MQVRLGYQDNSSLQGNEKVITLRRKSPIVHSSYEPGRAPAPASASRIAWTAAACCSAVMRSVTMKFMSVWTVNPMTFWLKGFAKLHGWRLNRRSVCRHC